MATKIKAKSKAKAKTNARPGARDEDQQTLVRFDPAVKAQMQAEAAELGTKLAPYLRDLLAGLGRDGRIAAARVTVDARMSAAASA